MQRVCNLYQSRLRLPPPPFVVVDNRIKSEHCKQLGAALISCPHLEALSLTGLLHDCPLCILFAIECVVLNSSSEITMCEHNRKHDWKHRLSSHRHLSGITQ
jgi:hypothetical protein